MLLLLDSTPARSHPFVWGKSIKRKHLKPSSAVMAPRGGTSEGSGGPRSASTSRANQTGTCHPWDVLFSRTAGAPRRAATAAAGRRKGRRCFLTGRAPTKKRHTTAVEGRAKLPCAVMLITVAEGITSVGIYSRSFCCACSHKG